MSGYFIFAHNITADELDEILFQSGVTAGDMEEFEEPNGVFTEILNDVQIPNEIKYDMYESPDEFAKEILSTRLQYMPSEKDVIDAIDSKCHSFCDNCEAPRALTMHRKYGIYEVCDSCPAEIAYQLISRADLSPKQI